MSKKFKNDDILGIINGILDTVSDLAHNAAESLMSDSVKQDDNVKSVINYNEIADNIANQKVKWWKPVLKYVIGGALLVPAIALLSICGWFVWLPELILASLSLLFFIPAGFLFSSASKDRRLRAMIKEYIPAIGMRPEASVDYLSFTLNKKEKSVKKDISRLLRSGVFPDVAYYDKKLKILVLDGYKETEKSETESNTNLYDLDSWIKKLNMFNLEIRNAEITSKISILADYIKKIKEYVAKNPDREKRLRTFVNYYLPTTIKLLDSYKTIEGMGEVGKNVRETKQKIEGSLEMLITAYENQLEALYNAEAMDISGDIDVLETMIKRDGFDKKK